MLGTGSFVADLRTLLGFPNFRRLFAVRLTSQFTDGVFQAALASFVLFSPERQPTAGAIAGAFAVLLLPFSVLGPFCGVFLDRWSRRQVLFWANVVRAWLLLPVAFLVVRGFDGPAFYTAVLLVFSVTRFVLAGLSAALPHVVPGDRLVVANAISPTCGTAAYVVGLGAGTVLETVIRDQIRPVELGVLGLGVIGYLVAGMLALRMPRALLGPDYAVRMALRTAIADVVRGLVAGARHLRDRRQVAYALGMVGVHRFGYGISIVSALLLFRNYFNPGDLEAGLSGMSMVVAVSGVGLLAAALLTPIVVGRIGTRRWMVGLLGLAGAIQIFPAMLFTEVAVMVAALALGIATQGIKICVDTIVQQNIDDAYRGRVFSFYDMLFNLVFVGSVAFAALTLPESGKSYVVLAFVAICYWAAALAYGRTRLYGSHAKKISGSP